MSRLAAIVERVRMTAALKPPSLLRTATGEPPLGRNAEFFTDDQDEILEHDNPRHRSSLTRTGMLELEAGKWLVMPRAFIQRPTRQLTRRDAGLCDERNA